MDATHLHLLLNHLPILGTLFGICLLIYGLLGKNKSLENAGLITLVIITLLTIPAFLTGEGAEETVEHLQDVSEPYIEAHEDLAGVAFWLMMATGVMALFTFFVSTMRNNRNIILKIITVLLAVGTFVIMIMVGNYGGKIRHSELRKQSVIHIEMQIPTNSGIPKVVVYDQVKG